MVKEIISDSLFWKQTTAIGLLVLALFWAGYTYRTITIIAEQVSVIAERQRDVRERLAVVEQRLKIVDERMDSLSLYDRSDERRVAPSRIPPTKNF